MLRIVQFLRPPPELHRGVGQGFGSGGDDTVPKSDDPGQRVRALPADLGALDRGAASGSGFVQALEFEQAVDEPVFEDREGFEGGRHRGGSWPEMRSRGPYVVPKTRNTLPMEP